MRSRPHLSIAFILLFLFAGGAAVFGVRAYLDHKAGGKRPPHIALYVLTNGVLVVNDESRTFRNITLCLDAPTGGWGGYRYTFPELRPGKGASMDYQKSLQDDTRVPFPTNRTPRTVGPEGKSFSCKDQS